MSPKTVLVTGGAGFIGSTVVRALLAAEGIAEVRAIDDLSTGSTTNLEGLDAVSLVEASILDDRALSTAMAGCDAVVHLAARASVPDSIKDPVTTNRVNVTGSINVLEAARRHGNAHVIVASSSAVYGDGATLPKHEDLPVRPVSPYAVSKVATEQYAISYQICNRLPTLALRFFNVYGPSQPADHVYAAAIPAFIDAALHQRPVNVFGDGRQTRDFVACDTVAALIVNAVQRCSTASTPVNVASGDATSLLDLLDALEEVLAQPISRRFHPPRHGDVLHSHADIGRMTRLFPGLSPVPLTRGLRTTVEWHRRHVRPPT